ncbi:MAG: ABC transporter permease subunit [Propionibacteriaceae bacterium]|jgi:NitT/TauT family transport system permease protein|nr:ABC transporter permease subunit [Propionibacteriaceae bacterium]
MSPIERLPQPRLSARIARIALAVVFWLLVWQGLAMIVGSRLLLASPLDAAAALAALACTPGFWLTVVASTGRILIGFLIAQVMGAVLALLAGRLALIDWLITPAIRVVQAVPVVSFVLLVLLWADQTALASIIVACMVTPLVYINWQTALRHRQLGLFEMAQLGGVGPWRRWWAIDLPQLLPGIEASAVVGVGLAWKSGVSAEVIGLTSGSIGERLYQAKVLLATGDLFAWTAVVVLMAFLFERLLVWALGRLRAGLGAYLR